MALKITLCFYLPFSLEFLVKVKIKVKGKRQCDQLYKIVFSKISLRFGNKLAKRVHKFTRYIFFVKLVKLKGY